ncbi:MAG: chemotaxis-specific protein-glutamate methyltransferase CheB [Candidatus Eremiobacteraeota bacterium]|nr:chemotaxis-specific protein-glutamate methyltransferase CheB [Candidatus Eremiobacteraeota bacterium]
MAEEAVKVLVADDSTIFRNIIKGVLEQIPGVSQVSTAYNGRVAVEKIPSLMPDLVVVDMDMPEMNGLEVLKFIKATAPHISTVLITSHVSQSATLSLQALHEGALDMILKPDSPKADENMEVLAFRLKSLVQVVLDNKRVSALLKAAKEISPADRGREPQRAADSAYEKISYRRIEAVGIAISTGGPVALRVFIPRLPGDLPVPVFIVQHMPATFTAALAESLDKISALKVVEAASGDAVKPGTVYIAPGGRHMKVQRDEHSNLPVIVATDDPMENYCRPSADYLFRSLAGVYGGRVLGVIMTGMGEDGVKGLKMLKALNAPVIAQDESTSVVFGMPREAIRAQIVDTVLPLELMARAITRFALSEGE